MPTRSQRSEHLPTSMGMIAGSLVQSLMLVVALLGALVLGAPFDLSSNATDGAGMSSIHHHSVRSLRLSAEGKHVWVLRHPTLLQQVELNTGRVVDERSIVTEYISGLQVTSSAKEEAVVYLTTHGMMLQSLQSPDSPTTLFDVRGTSPFFAASPRHEFLAIGRDTMLELWSTTTKSLCRTVDLGCAPSRMVWAPNSPRLLLALTDGRLQILDGESLTVQHSQLIPTQGGVHVTWAENEETIGVFNESGTSFVWNLQSGLLDLNQSDKAFLNVAVLSPDGQWLAVPDEGNQLWLVSSADGAERHRLGTASSSVHALCFTADGTSLLVGCNDGVVECWNVNDGSIQWSLRGPSEQNVLSRPAASHPKRPVRCNKLHVGRLFVCHWLCQCNASLRLTKDKALAEPVAHLDLSQHQLEQYFGAYMQFVGSSGERLPPFVQRGASWASTRS